MEFNADQVWGLAVRADKLNDGYCKEPVYAATESHGIDYNQVIKTPNKALVKQWLRENIQPTEEEIAAGQVVRNHFKGYTLQAIAGKLNEFQQTALRIAAMDTFTGGNMLEFSLISCLPAAARRDTAKSDLKREIYASEQVRGIEGETIVGDIDVVECRYNPNFQKFRIAARMGESYVDFWFPKELKGTHRIKAKIKAHRGDKTTQLNYVKKI